MFGDGSLLPVSQRRLSAMTQMGRLRSTLTTLLIWTRLIAARRKSSRHFVIPRIRRGVSSSQPTASNPPRRQHISLPSPDNLSSEGAAVSDQGCRRPSRALLIDGGRFPGLGIPGYLPPPLRGSETARIMPNRIGFQPPSQRRTVAAGSHHYNPNS